MENATIRTTSLSGLIFWITASVIINLTLSNLKDYYLIKVAQVREDIYINLISLIFSARLSFLMAISRFVASLRFSCTSL